MESPLGNPPKLSPSKSERTLSWDDPRVRGAVYQALLVAVIGFLGYEIVTNTIDNLTRLNIASGYGFLDENSGFGIIQALIPYSEASTFGRALQVGLLNTLLVAAIGIILATILGFVIGVARLSSNWVIAQIAYWYVEIIRNVPLLLQIFFWYFAVLRAVPDKRSKWSLFDTIHLNIAGLRLPKPIFEPGSSAIALAFLAALVGVFVLQVHDERAIDLEGVDRQALQVAQ